LFSTHILSEAEQVCDRVLIINKGRIVAQGKPADLRRQLEPKTQLHVVIGGANSKQARQLLKEIPGVRSVEREGEGFTLTIEANQDIRAEVSSYVMNAGYSLLEMRQAATTLEDIFLEIVGKSQ